LFQEALAALQKSFLILSLYPVKLTYQHWRNRLMVNEKNEAGQTSRAEMSRASTRAIHFKYFQDICHAIGCHISTCSIPIASRQDYGLTPFQHPSCPSHKIIRGCRVSKPDSYIN
jgi:hypothetical protein